MIMKIKIGREQGQARLRLLCNGRETFYGEKGSVDLSVSKEHCEIDIEPNGKVTIVNLNPDNETFVNGKSIIKKQVDQMSIESIGLGSNGYSFALPEIVRALGLKETYSIGHLKSIIESYKDAKLAIQIKNGFLHSTEHAIRHEIMHFNDRYSDHKIDEEDADLIDSIMPVHYIDGEPVLDYENCLYKEELLNAGIGVKHIKYAYTNRKEFLAVAAEGDFSKYSPEFKGE